MKVLLYLPVVTPWWFQEVVTPILRRLATVADVHVLAPIPWQNTGLGPRELAGCRDLTNVTWHIIDSADHPSLRTTPVERDDLLAYVHALSPDIVLCRSADFATASAFPGTVRFLMETCTTLFQPGEKFMITERPFANGVMPDLGPANRATLDELIDPLWTAMHAHWDRTMPDRGALCHALGLPDGEPMFLLPLEYEHPENFFRQHRPDGIGHEQMLAAIADAVTPHGTLVVTDHPLNVAYVDRAALRNSISRLGDRVVLAPARLLDASATLALARHADGMLVGDSKSFAMAAAFGVPTMRRTRFESAGWLNAYDELPGFIADVCHGDARVPAETATRLWFAYHIADEAFDPRHPALTGEEIVDRCRQPLNPARWNAGMRRVWTATPERVR
jgi:hypothetical protein